MTVQNNWLHIDKWQRMLSLVQGHNVLLQKDLNKEFQKLTVKRLFASNLLVFLLQYIGISFSLQTPIHLPILFASGISCGFMFLRGYSIFPGIWLGSFLAYFCVNADTGAAFNCATLIALQAVALLIFSYRFISPTLLFYYKHKLIKFFVFTSLLTAFISFLFVYAYFPRTLSFQLWLIEWFSNLNGILIFSCALVTWDAYFSDINILKEHSKKFIFNLFYGLLITFGVLLLFSHEPLSIIWFAWLTLAFTILISISYGWCGAISAVFILGLLLNLAAYMQGPVFSGSTSSESLLFLQILLAMEAFIGMYISLPSLHLKSGYNNAIS